MLKGVKKERVKSYILLVILLVVFGGMFAFFGVSTYNDSDQYIKMHIHREPLYPLLLWIFRMVFGTQWMNVVGIAQNIFTAVCIWLAAEYICKKFSLYVWEETVIVLLGTLPYFITRYFSALNIFIPNAIMSEAICIPLFMIFLVHCFEMFTEKQNVFRKEMVISLVLALLLSLTRSQMMSTILVWMVTLLTKLLREKAALRKKAVRMCGVFLVVIFAFSLRLFVVKCYNLAFNGHFINNTYGAVNTLTNILYASDREDGEYIKDDEAREFFYSMYDMAESRQATYRYAGESLEEKVCHIEQWHDMIKGEIIEDTFYQTYKRTIVDDYIVINLKADETSMEIIKGILPRCLTRWFANYLRMVCLGLIRSIAVVHPIASWLALFFYLSSMIMSFTIIKRRRSSEGAEKAAWLLVLVLLAVFGNVFTVAITIMPLSRYMIYGFSPFYTAYGVLTIMLARKWKEDKVRVSR
ncbi:MAG: hypothetical protein HDQ99_16805 [Lachnospiraceae bacterium]|nr:hypothetical protein [Lachnospiraceae bacterium]